MHYNSSQSSKSSPLLLGAFCSALLAFTACGDDDSSNAGSDFDCSAYQASRTENFTSSALVSQILESLNGKLAIDPEGIFIEDSQSVQAKLEAYGVEVSSQTKTSLNFKFSGMELSFKVLEAQEDLSNAESGNIVQTVKVSLSSKASSCELDYQKTFMDPSLCKAERTGETEQKQQDSTYREIDLKSNLAEFQDCIKKIAPASKEDSGNQRPSYDGEFN